MNNEITSYTFHIRGMHCKACVALIEDSIRELPYIEFVKVSLSNRELTITGVFTASPEKIAENLTVLVHPHGYTISTEKIDVARWEDFAYALPLAIALISVFLLLQKAGLANLITSASVGYGTAFGIGLIASVSSCLAVVGGLVLSLSASSAREGGTWRTQTLFHIGRLGGFFVLGGLIGVLGNSLHLSLMAAMILNVLVALVMLILGINLLEVFHFTKSLQFTMPAFFSKHLARGSRHDYYLAPALIGIGTFFLPCGFTQSMQLYALSTGNFVSGALTMLFFALGTLPMLALLSFGSLNIIHKPWKGIFFKTAGIIVIMLALFNLMNILGVVGVMNPLFNF